MKKVSVTVVYKGIDISSKIDENLKLIKYTDSLDAESPEARIELNDIDKVWQNTWFPDGGDEFSLQFAYAGDRIYLDAGTFEVDDLDFEFGMNGDILFLGGQATPVSKNLREKRSKEYENVTLKAIVEDIGTRQSLDILGKIPEVTFERLTQDEESDLEFLLRASKDWGVLFKIEGTKLIFYSWEELNAKPASFTLTKRNGDRFRVKKKTAGTYKSCEIRHSKADDEKDLLAIIEANPPNNSQDVLTISTKVESPRQAELKAQEELKAFL
ncbi:MAG: hypothetical protein AAGA60_20040 [Cyanobacteria bacterium P01_E01_bin.42]